MSSFIVEGGRHLKGKISPIGAKNEALQVICATLLTQAPVVLRNVPDISDIRNLISLLEQLGVETEHIDSHTIKFQAREINMEYLCTEDYRMRVKSLRGSIMIIGPLLARFGRAKLPKPGGDKIVRRRLDTHLIGWEKLGADFSYISDEKCFLI